MAQSVAYKKNVQCNRWVYCCQKKFSQDYQNYLPTWLGMEQDAGAALQEMRDKHPHAAPPPVPKGETSTEPLAVFSQDV